ncbi:hypothetical protein [Lactiplantibacillus pentosus]|uniref:hypothetical protein n=1 Tax=Lactiplantibacillus pentosus TaxID=1589 RepID=UPI003D2EC5B9
MPRPILHGTNHQANKLMMNANKQSVQPAQDTQSGRIGELLRQKRSPKYMQAVSKLDAGGVQLNQATINDLMATIQGEFPEVNLTGILQGYVARCYLGGTYDVHTLDWMLEIVTHFHRGEPLSGGLERARSLAKRGYAYIEVYSDCCRAISENGDVSVVKV